MAAHLKNITTADNYAQSATIQLPQAERVVVQIANAAVYYELDLSERGDGQWGEEAFLSPSIGTLNRRCSGIRFRSALAGAAAQVSADLLNAADLADQGSDSLAPFTSTVTPAGGVAGGSNLTTIALAAFPPATPAEGDSYFLVLPSSFDPVGGKPVRWLVTYDAGNSVWHATGPPLLSQVDTSEGTASTSYTNLATVGPALALPRPGDYHIEVGALFGLGGASALRSCWMSYDLGVGAADADACLEWVDSSVGAQNAGSRAREKSGVGAVTVTAKYRVSNAANSAVFERRWMRVTPLRLT